MAQLVPRLLSGKSHAVRRLAALVRTRHFGQLSTLFLPEMQTRGVGVDFDL
jgi:hypothetical protein